MKANQHEPMTVTVQRQKRHAKCSQPGLQRGRLQGPTVTQGRARQKTGSYKRVEVYLGMEGAIALRRLMRDGRSASEVIEALLLAEKQRIKEHP